MGRDNRANRYTPETRERAVRMVLENESNYRDRSATIRAIAPKIGCSRGVVAPVGGAVRGRPRPARWGEQRRAHQGVGARGARAAPGQRDPEEGECLFCPGGARPPTETMIAFIEEHGMCGLTARCNYLMSLLFYPIPNSHRRVFKNFRRRPVTQAFARSWIEAVANRPQISICQRSPLGAPLV